MNNVRLSKGAEESDPKEIFSGDIVQFGVEVVENSKRGAGMSSVSRNATKYIQKRFKLRK